MHDHDQQQPDTPSKSALKRQMTALQELGESLLLLNPSQLASLPIENERLLQAIADAQRIKSKNARKRQLQYIGKLMRDIDPAPLRVALDALKQPHRQAVAKFHQLEQLRDRALAAGDNGVELLLQEFPEADRQQLRQMVLQHAREVARSKPPAASRKLFRYLRSLQEQRE